MPNIKSAKKRVKVIATKTMQNKAINSQLKTEIKKANAAIDGNAADKEAAVRVAIKNSAQGLCEPLRCFFVAVSGFLPIFRLTFLWELGIINW